MITTQIQVTCDRCHSIIRVDVGNGYIRPRIEEIVPEIASMGYTKVGEQDMCSDCSPVD